MHSHQSLDRFAAYATEVYCLSDRKINNFKIPVNGHVVTAQFITLTWLFRPLKNRFDSGSVFSFFIGVPWSYIFGSKLYTELAFDTSSGSSFLIFTGCLYVTVCCVLNDDDDDDGKPLKAFDELSISQGSRGSSCGRGSCNRIKFWAYRNDWCDDRTPAGCLQFVQHFGKSVKLLQSADQKNWAVVRSSDPGAMTTAETSDAVDWTVDHIKVLRRNRFCGEWRDQWLGSQLELLLRSTIRHPSTSREYNPFNQFNDTIDQWYEQRSFTHLILFRSVLLQVFFLQYYSRIFKRRKWQSGNYNRSAIHISKIQSFRHLSTAHRQENGSFAGGIIDLCVVILHRLYESLLRLWFDENCLQPLNLRPYTACLPRVSAFV